jgi:hypothetical protein
VRHYLARVADRGLATAVGQEAKRHGGRFDPPGTAALYLSCSLETAWLEAPMTVCVYRLDMANLVDLTAPAVWAPRDPCGSRLRLGAAGRGADDTADLGTGGRARTGRRSGSARALTR